MYLFVEYQVRLSVLLRCAANVMRCVSVLGSWGINTDSRWQQCAREESSVDESQ